jgi:hypothetical protein
MLLHRFDKHNYKLTVVSPSPILPGAIWPHIVPGVFFAVTVAKKNGTTGMVNVKTADDRKAK